MTAPVVSPKPASIQWTFQIQEQGFTTRYGIAGVEYYKQYMPFGVRDDLAHPPKRIDHRLYLLAQLKASTPKPSVQP